MRDYGMSEKGRERILKEIDTLDQAVKAEKDVESGYHGVIDENITYWLAVEQDIVESYTKLAKGIEDKKAKTTLTGIVEDSKKHIRMLTSIRKSFDTIMADEHRHTKLLQELADRQRK
jgi:rubrerythrin